VGEVFHHRGAYSWQGLAGSTGSHRNTRSTGSGTTKLIDLLEN